MKFDETIKLNEIQHAHSTAIRIVNKYGGPYLPVLLRLDIEKRKAEEIERILMSAVLENL